MCIRDRIQLAGRCFPRAVLDILHLFKRHAKPLQPLGTGCQNRFRVDFAQILPHPPPDRLLSLGGNLLPDDMMHDRRKQIVIDGSLDRADLIDNRAQFRIPLL